MVVKKATITENNISQEEKIVTDLVMISRILEKYKHIRCLDAAMYIVDGYLEELEDIEWQVNIFERVYYI